MSALDEIKVKFCLIFFLSSIGIADPTTLISLFKISVEAFKTNFAFLDSA